MRSSPSSGDLCSGARQPRRLACVEVGGSGIQTVVFDGSDVSFLDGVRVPPGAEIALAVPGHLRDGTLVSASNLGWHEVDAVDALGLAAAPSVICNDAEAAALGEWVLRGTSPDGLVLVGLGTGVGGGIVRPGGATESNLFGHQSGYSDRTCRCGATGCLETVAAGWALPDPVPDSALRSVAEAVATSLAREPAAAGIDTVVLAGGLVDRNPRLLERVADVMPARHVEPSARPPGSKSASAWGLRHLCSLSVHAVPRTDAAR